jgi:hypothetical protein
VTRFVRYVSCDIDVANQAIAFFAGGVFLALMLPGDEVELAELATECEVVPVTADLVGSVAAGTSRLVPNTVSGEVDVDSGWRQTLRGRQRIGCMERQATAGFYPAVLLHSLKPDFETAPVTVRSLRVSMNPAGSIRLYIFKGDGAPVGALQIAQSVSKQNPVNESDAIRLSAYDNATAYQSAIGGIFAKWTQPIAITRPTTVDFELIQAGPIYLPSNHALALMADVAGSQLQVNYNAEYPSGYII